MFHLASHQPGYLQITDLPLSPYELHLFHASKPELQQVVVCILSTVPVEDLHF